MIYKRNANFPYPLLTNDSIAYKDNTFIFDCDLSIDNNNYIFSINVSIGSFFVKTLLLHKHASMYLIIDSTDSHYYLVEDYNHSVIKVPINYISLKKNLKLQLMIKANKTISFANNNDLIDFYHSFKDQINIHDENMLGFSNVIQFNGSMKKPMMLFDKRLDPNMKKDISFELGNENITIVFKKEEYELNELSDSRNLLNIYLYHGLYIALEQFIINNNLSDDNISLDSCIPNSDLDNKLLVLMQASSIQYLTKEDIEDVICKISDHLIEKYTHTVRSLNNNGN